MSEARSERLRREDAAARLGAQEVLERPFLLEAGAGTGKTAVLVARICVWALGPGWERAEAQLTEEGGAAPRAERIAALALRRIVAITFTEAAAAEMAVRVGAALLDLQRGLPVPGLALERLPGPVVLDPRARALVGALDQLGVRTIHAFCRRLLAAHAIEARLHPRFEVDADGAGVEAVARDVMERHLRRAWGDPGDEDALLLARESHGPAEIEAALGKLLQEGVPPERLDDPLSDERVQALLTSVGERVDEFLAVEGGRLRDQGRSRVARDAAHAVATLRERAAEAAAGAEGLVAFQHDIAPTLEAAAARLGPWSRGKLETQAEQTALGADAEAFADAARGLLPWVRLLRDLDPVVLRVGFRVLRPLLSEARDLLRTRGVETYAALLQDALTLLGDGEVAGRARREIDQLLVDEFQDTDALQCEILRALALEGPPEERPGLFLVGDPKQSIYGWRNADLRAYESFQSDVVAAEGEKATLSVNHRSAPAVLDEVERLVAPVMHAEPGVQPRFEPLVASEANEARTGFAGAEARPIEHWVTWTWPEGASEPETGPRAADAALLEAEALARDLHRLHRDAELSWRDVGLLFRSLSDVDRYLEALRAAGIPYVVERDHHYYERREVLDAGALVRAVLDPHDQVALVAALRSAVVGVPDAALVPLWERAFPDGFAKLLCGLLPASELRDRVREAAAALPPGVPGLERVAGWEESLVAFVALASVLRTTLREEPADVFVERLRTFLLLEPCEAARTLGGFRLANLDRFFRDLRRALETCGGDVAGVLAALRHSVSEIREHDEGRPRAADGDAVRVLTVHGAKGLEFGHVYLLQLHKGPGTDTRVDARVERRGSRLALRLFGQASLDFPDVAADRQRVEEAERARLLYVAATRARERLVLVGRRGGGRESLAALLARRSETELDLAELMTRLHGEGEAAADEAGARWVFPALQSEAPPRVLRSREAAPDPSALRSEAAALRERRAGALGRSARPFHTTASEAEADLSRGELTEASAEARYADASGDEAETAPAPAPFEASDERVSRSEALAVGTAVHAALEHVDLGLAREAAGAALAASLDQWLPAGLSLAARARAESRLRGFVEGPLFERARALAPRVVARELPVLLAPGEDDAATGFLSGAIDLIYRDPETGGLVVADWKTDEVATGAEVAARAAAYAGQGAVYTRALQRALGLEAAPVFELWFLGPGEVVRPALSAPDSHPV